MKKRIFLCLALLSCLLMIFTSLSMAGIYYKFYQDQVKASIHGDTALMAEELNAASNPMDVLNAQRKALGPTLRITYIQPDGTVTYDTDADVNTLENHASRQEFILAKENGEGESLRYSTSLGLNTYYYAILLDNGSVLRLSQPLNHIGSLFLKTVPFLILVLAAILVLAVMVVRWLTDTLMEPINLATRSLDSSIEGGSSTLETLDTYEELVPFLRKINQLNRELHLKIRELQDQRDTLNTLLKNMDEGFVLLNPDYQLLAINPSARRLLSVPLDAPAVGQNFLEVNRNLKLQNSIRQVLSNPQQSLSLALDENQYYLNPVSTEGHKLLGVLMLIVDMTPAMKAEQSRREFASNVSHELKTPLTSIHGFAEMMANHMVPTVDFDQIAQRIHMESGRLIRLIDDIIRLSQIESQGVPRTREQAALDQIAREMLAHLEPVAQQKKVTLESHLEPVTLVASGAYMEELLYNLLDNAIKYNKEGGSVTLTLEKLPKEARITVADTGIGMEAVHLDRIFERFYRVDKSRSKQTGGTGLGLSIVKHIVENYGGTIAVESTPDQGTTFTVHLPL
jgi:two-component system phosphate regulon sensor histidine kinase PhoR